MCIRLQLISDVTSTGSANGSCADASQRNGRLAAGRLRHFGQRLATVGQPAPQGHTAPEVLTQTAVSVGIVIATISGEARLGGTPPSEPGQASSQWTPGVAPGSCEFRPPPRRRIDRTVILALRVFRFKRRLEKPNVSGGKTTRGSHFRAISQTKPRHFEPPFFLCSVSCCASHIRRTCEQIGV
jgi:hypothetical protein